MGSVDMRLYALLVLHTLALAFASTSAQQGAPERYRYAQALEQSGDQRGAARIYQELYTERPNEDRYFDGVVRTLSALGQHASLVPIIEERVAKAPSVPLLNQLAMAQWKSGMTVTATEQWQRALALAGNAEDALVEIGEAQLLAGAATVAMPTFERARSVNGNKRAHAFVIGRIALATGDVARATTEFIEDYRDRSDLLQTQGQLAAIMATPEGVRTVRDKLRGNEPEILRLRVWFYQEVKEWNQAFEVVKMLDAATRAAGQELYTFAERARRDGQYDVAIEAFGYVADMSAAADQWRQNALYWYVRTLDQRIRGRGKTVTSSDAATIIARYEDVIQRSPRNPFAADALYHIGVLQGDVLKDREQARLTMQRLMNSWRGTTAAADAGLYVSDLAVVADQLNVAEQILLGLESLPVTNDLAMRRDMAVIKRADILAWKGLADSARRLYMAVASRPGSAASNDAFERLMMFQLTDEDTATRSQILLGDRMMIARREDVAAQHYEAAALGTKDTELRDRCRWRASVAWNSFGNVAEAERLAQSIANDAPESIVGDRALFVLAEIKERGGDVSAAMKHLTDLLTYYPSSILVPRARERLRLLRGDVKG